MYPKVHVNKRKLAFNASKIYHLCKEQGIDPVAVLKVSNGSLDLLNVAVKSGFTTLGDSRVLNLKSFESSPLNKLLIRSSMISQASQVVQYCDTSCESELLVLEALSEAAVKQGKVHNVLLTVELGDLREGIYGDESLIEITKKARALPGISIGGISGNFFDLSGVSPSVENLTELVRKGKIVAELCQIQDPIFSGGNSSSLDLVINKTIPKEINQIRTGAGWLIGLIDGTYQDAFTIDAEVIEVGMKPSMPWGERTANMAGEIPEYEDRGLRRRAIVGLGLVDIAPDVLFPLEPGIELIGTCSDHLVLDIEDLERDISPGDIISFALGYRSILRSFSNRHCTIIFE